MFIKVLITIAVAAGVAAYLNSIQDKLLVRDFAKKYGLSEQEAETMMYELKYQAHKYYFQHNLYVEMSDGTVFDTKNGGIVVLGIYGGEFQYFHTGEEYKYFSYFKKQVQKIQVDAQRSLQKQKPNK